MSNFPTLRAGALTVGDCSDKAPVKKRHNAVLCEPAASQSGPAYGATGAGLHRLRSERRCLSVRLRIGRADTSQHLQNPRARAPRHLNG